MPGPKNAARSLTAAAGLLLAGLAIGHAKLLTSTPAADAQLRDAPTSLTLKFNENVRLAALQLTLADKPIALKVDHAAAAAPEVTLTLPVLLPGSYAVHWSALSPDDGHVAKGSFAFVILAPT
jgi:methionine-rich copper-binding protein CopC